MVFTRLMRILQHLLYSYVVIISFILCIVLFSETSTKFEESEIQNNELMNYVKNVGKKYIPFLEEIGSLFIDVIIMFIIYILYREGCVRRFVHLLLNLDKYLETLVTWFFRLLHAEPAVRDNQQFHFRYNRINRNYRDAQDYERDLIVLCRLQYEVILTAVEFEKSTREYYISDLVELHSTRILSSLGFTDLKIHEDRDANSPPHHITGRGQRLSHSPEPSRDRASLMRRNHPRNSGQAQELPLSDFLLELQERLRQIGCNHGQDLSQQSGQMQ